MKSMLIKNTKDLEKIKSKKGFTLVELIIVITILAILATIAFISFQGYSKNARDGNRLATLKNMDTGLQIYKTKVGNYPMPEDYITILSSGSLIGYQGYFGDESSRGIQMSKVPLDPLDGERFTYTTTESKTNYQILIFLETNEGLSLNNTNFTNKVYAGNVDYTNRILKTSGDEIGILVGSTGSNINRPIQEFKTTSFTGVNIRAFTGLLPSGDNLGSLKSIFNKDDTVILSTTDFVRLENNYKKIVQIPMLESCPIGWIDKGILRAGGSIFVLDSTPITVKLCENKINSQIPLNSSLIFTDSCPSGWNNKGLFDDSSTSVLLGINFGNTLLSTSFYVCENISDNSIPKDSTVLIGYCTDTMENKGKLFYNGGAPASRATRLNGLTYPIVFCKQ